MERKLLQLDTAELKFSSDSGVMSFEGYASTFGGIDSYGDTIDPKAYDKTLARKKNSRPVRMRWNHYGPVIGKWVALATDSRGLYAKGELTPGHSVATDVYASLKHGAVDGMSIGYIAKRAEDIAEGRRLLTEIELVEISVVEDPADNGAKIRDVKAAIEQCESLKEIESLLRDAGGFSRSDAVTLVARVRALFRGDREAEKQTAQSLARLFQHHTNN